MAEKIKRNALHYVLLVFVLRRFLGIYVALDARFLYERTHGVYRQLVGVAPRMAPRKLFDGV